MMYVAIIQHTCGSTYRDIFDSVIGVGAIPWGVLTMLSVFPAFLTNLIAISSLHDMFE